MAIIISKNGKNAKKIEKSSFEKEDYLQKYVYDNPETLPLYEIQEDIRVLIVAREFPIKSGSIDALGIDMEGEIYIIETKLYKNPDKRLVVAQVLDYGASLWHSYSDFDEFLRIVDNKINKEFEISSNQKLKDFFNIVDEEVSALIGNVKRNLNDGKFKFVVLMDTIHSQLKDLIIFINQNSRFDIFGVEIEYYKFQNYEIMVPRLYGSEVKKEVGISRTRKKWDEKSFFEDVKNRLKENQVKSINILYEFSKKKADQMGWGTGAIWGSFNPKFLKISNRSLYSVNSDGTLQINFGYLHVNETAEKYRDDFKRELEKFEDITIPSDYQGRFVNVPIEKWGPKVNDLIKIIEGLIGG